MIARTFSLTYFGLQPRKVEVEIDCIFGKPQLTIIGLPAPSIAEAKERITAALTSCNVHIKARHTIINLAPADLRKQGSNLELAIAVALLKLYGHVHENTDDAMFFGELSLDGSIKPIRGALVFAQTAKALGFKRIVVPAGNSQELVCFSGLHIHPIKHLAEIIRSSKNNKLPLLPVASYADLAKMHQPNPQIFDMIIGQKQAKRALELSIAGGHHLMLVGPPGTGKTMLATAAKELMPTLSPEEALEVTGIHSLKAPTSLSLITAPPFRSPHHTISKAGLLGGGANILPGEVSLAHRGVLFLDEFPELARDCIEALRESLQEGTISLVRAQGTISYPARFTLIAAANPCPCGYYQSISKACVCSPQRRLQYKQKFSGPILDRIDLCAFVESTKQHTIAESLITNDEARSGKSEHKDVIARIKNARQKQHDRYAHIGVIHNSQLTAQTIKELHLLTATVQRYLVRATEALNMSTRSFLSTIKVAQTIADISGADQIQEEHIGEALQFRQVRST